MEAVPSGGWCPVEAGARWRVVVPGGGWLEGWTCPEQGQPKERVNMAMLVGEGRCWMARLAVGYAGRPVVPGSGLKGLRLDQATDMFLKHNEKIAVSINLYSLVFLSSDTLEPTYQQLQKMKLDKSPFVVVSVVGQELLTAGHHGASVVVLEAALKIGTCSLKLRGSVFSALSSAHWSLGNTEKSTGYMQQDLDVAKTLGMRFACMSATCPDLGMTNICNRTFNFKALSLKDFHTARV